MPNSSGHPARRCEIWWADLDPSIGAEIGKKRPVVIASSTSLGTLPLRIVVPITGWREQFASSPWHTLIRATPETGLKRDGTADAFQVRAISPTRLSDRLGVVSPEKLDEIAMAVALLMGYPPS